MKWRDSLDAIRRAAKDRVGPATSKVTLRNGSVDWTAVDANPVILHQKSGLDRNTYCGARCIASEYGDSSAEYLLAAGECLRNRSRITKTEIYQMLVWKTTSKYAFTRGKYGSQKGRKAATHNDPYQKHLTAIRCALDGSDFLPSNAYTWDEPRLQDKWASEGSHGTTQDAVSIAREWGQEDNLYWVGPLPNIDPMKMAIFCKGDKPTDNQALVDVILAARKGKSFVGPNAPGIHGEVNRKGIPYWILIAGAGTALLL